MRVQFGKEAIFSSKAKKRTVKSQYTGLSMPPFAEGDTTYYAV